ncbi:hypothetical protein AB9K35_00255 [Leisingera sp. XS_AS12]|uniref:hypothetical protein n=1 Tax=Leisingera sp. XS_AS12 TaxID=3241294 RepID=UPI003516F52C
MKIFEHDGWPKSPTAWFELLSCIALAIALTTVASSFISASWPLLSLATAFSAVAAVILVVCAFISWLLVLAALKGRKEWKTAWIQISIALVLAGVLFFQVSIPVAKVAADIF